MKVEKRITTGKSDIRTFFLKDFYPAIQTPRVKHVISGFAEVGCVSSHRYQQTVRVRDSLQDALAALRDVSLSATTWRLKLPRVHISEMKAANPTQVTNCWTQVVNPAGVPLFQFVVTYTIFLSVAWRCFSTTTRPLKCWSPFSRNAFHPTQNSRKG